MMRSMRSFSIILVSPFSQLLEQDVPQVVQCFSELDRVHQGMAAHIGLVVPVEIRPAEVEHGDLFAVGLEPDGG